MLLVVFVLIKSDEMECPVSCPSAIPYTIILCIMLLPVPGTQQGTYFICFLYFCISIGVMLKGYVIRSTTLSRVFFSIDRETDETHVDVPEVLMGRFVHHLTYIPTWELR